MYVYMCTYTDQISVISHCVTNEKKKLNNILYPFRVPPLTLGTTRQWFGTVGDQSEYYSSEKSDRL